MVPAALLAGVLVFGCGTTGGTAAVSPPPPESGGTDAGGAPSDPPGRQPDYVPCDPAHPELPCTPDGPPPGIEFPPETGPEAPQAAPGDVPGEEPDPSPAPSPGGDGAARRGPRFVPGEGSCNRDADCVSNDCCLPTTCVSRRHAPDCPTDGTCPLMRTRMDIGRAECSCQDQRCGAQYQSYDPSWDRASP
jgi:hypothetical protein